MPCSHHPLLPSTHIAAGGPLCWGAPVSPKPCLPGELWPQVARPLTRGGANTPRGFRRRNQNNSLSCRCWGDHQPPPHPPAKALRRVPGARRACPGQSPSSSLGHTSAAWHCPCSYPLPTSSLCLCRAASPARPPCRCQWVPGGWEQAGEHSVAASCLPGGAGLSQSSALPAVTTQRPFPSPGRLRLQEMSFFNSSWDLFPP